MNSRIQTESLFLANFDVEKNNEYRGLGVWMFGGLKFEIKTVYESRSHLLNEL